MSTPPPPPGQSGPEPQQNPSGPDPYGQQPPSPGYGSGGAGQGGSGPGGPWETGPGSPYDPPPKKGGVPTWAWIIGGVAALTLFCICGVGGLVFIGVMNAEDSPTQEQTESTTSESTTSESTTSGSATDEPSTPGSSTSEPSATSTTPTAPDSSVPTPPEGTTPNTSSLNQLPRDDVEKHVAKGLSGAGHTRDDISCPEHLVLIKGRTTTCTAPVPGDPGARSDVEVTVDWAVIDDDNRVSFYLSFQQSLN